MPTKAELEKICATIVQRRAAREAVVCPACRQGCSDGMEELWDHLSAAHGIDELPPLDNLTDEDAFLALVPALAGRQLLVSSDDVSKCFLLAAADDDGADVEADNEAAARGVTCEDEDDFDDGVPTACLFCSTVSTSVETHMQQVHGFDFRGSTLFDHTICADEYGRMRMVNYTRRQVERLRCPAGCCAEVSTSSELTRHIEAEKHFLPTTCPDGDEHLAPALKGDGMLMLVMEVEDDFNDGDQYPMVPTVGDTLQRRMTSQHTNDA
uniref:C2H2-type domain-containing protein n=1 Tax=Neobodo designis TaxID=312471 RepID=A0A7S1MIM4_NEODS|mmetsp:Transcript_41368/g.127878  ORF Transcript_41368/g.127878 Transcript_41368/m.127878 type:complete len:267 (+) Transcript_41368:38-838(+)